MKRKINLFLSCFVCICMLACGVLPVQAAGCPHTVYITDGVPRETGKVIYNESGHLIEQGTAQICTSCGYVFYVNLTYRHENHVWSDKLELGNEAGTGKPMFFYRCTTPGCDYINATIYFKSSNP